MPSGYFTDRTFWKKRQYEGTQKNLIPIDLELLKKRYLEDKISTYKLAKEFSVSNGTLIKRLKKANILLRGCSEAQKLIPHKNVISILGYKKWYSKCQSKEAREKRSKSHMGKKFTMERRLNMSKGIGRGKVNKNYLGNKAGYKAVHEWMKNNWIKSGICKHCKKSKKTVWANRTGKYLREDRNDWLELCGSCHKVYDIKNNILIPTWFKDFNLINKKFK